MTIFRPRDLATFGPDQKLPILLWGNGACANTTQEHKNFLNEIASHGYIVLGIGPLDQIENRDDTAKQPTNSHQLLVALDWIVAESKTTGSPYFGKIETTKVAAMGMSCGGLQAIEISGDPRISTTIVCNSGVLPEPSTFKVMPALSKDVLQKYHNPVLYIMGGPSDIAYKNAMDDFARVNHVPIVMTNLDVGHGGTYGQPHGGEFTRVALAWLDWQLKGRTNAAKMFVGENSELSRDPKWTIQTKNLGAVPSAANESRSTIAPLTTEFVYEAIVEIGAAVEVGPTARGQRRYIPITGGTFQGDAIHGVVLPGGADWQTQRADGVTEVDALYSIKCDDGTVIIVHNSGVIAENGKYLRTAPRFEAPDGTHAWLNRSQFLGSIAAGPRPGTVAIRVFRVL